MNEKIFSFMKLITPYLRAPISQTTIASPHFVQFQSFNPPQRYAAGKSHAPLAAQRCTMHIPYIPIFATYACVPPPSMLSARL
jgi:hypothetical protein